MSRKIVFGDIHGGYRALQQVLDRVEPQQTDQLIFLGDYVDGWSQSAQVIDCLLELEQHYNCVFIRGNHDVFCHNWLAKGMEEPMWHLHGGGPVTKNSYASHSATQRAQHVGFFERLRNFYVDEENRLFIHAGFTSLHGVYKEHYETNFYWDRSLLETALLLKDSGLDETSPYFPKRFRHYNEIYIGHTPTTNYGVDTPMQLERLCNVDTGAAYKGCLSAMDVISRQVWQSAPVYQLYPTEHGRN